MIRDLWASLGLLQGRPRRTAIPAYQAKEFGAVKGNDCIPRHPMNCCP